MIVILPLLIGWVLDLLIGDPTWLPHPVVGFGKMISWGEHRLNQGLHRMLKGALLVGDRFDPPDILCSMVSALSVTVSS